MRYLLDTNAVIALLKRQPDVTARVMRNGRREHGLSAIVAHEFLYGAYRSDRPEETLAVFDELRMPVLDFTVEDARRAGARPRARPRQPQPQGVRPRAGPRGRELGSAVIHALCPACA